MIPCIFNWSGGKDSALALYHCLQNPTLDIRYLVTTINDTADRISMHGVRTELLVLQAQSIGIPLYQIRLPEMPDTDTYGKIISSHLAQFKLEGITHSIYGDIHLEDLKAYRDHQLAGTGLTGIYPLWKRDTNELINEFLDLGFGTVIACVRADLKVFAGKEITQELIKNLPVGVDVCGENGEFHTFAFKGPIFKKEVKYKTGELVIKQYQSPKKDSYSDDQEKLSEFWFCDLLPA
ncbi:Dph6-related ATP pyrophosphatase [Mucilaginibacter glaciei]|uniref:Diphthine--ammonia ligase n=1 Tax=Mucilaginibacter glaciei TaxID=2772109 RepID=A0A926NQP8_9SPHI|nr:diphthine--ammonia ligase [Mucilaginibacter glaciei]MBD1392115.1 diphthine--ammonia ligase [Mucilaginibacter glaciei]